jgi:hypothetical protein
MASRSIGAFLVLRARQLEQLDREQHVVEHLAPRQQHRLLKHHADLASRARHRLPLIEISPSVASINPATIMSRVLLPQPLGPSRLRNSPPATIERDVSYRFEIVIKFAHGLDVQCRRGRTVGGSAGRTWEASDKAAVRIQVAVRTNAGHVML